MTRIVAVLNAAVLGVACVVSAPARSAEGDVWIVGVKGGALIMQSPSGVTHELAKSGPKRALPVWSSDGRRVAFVEASEAGSVGELVVLTREGKEQVRVPIEPARDGVAYAGMRYIEALEWVAQDRVAVRGSLNPSQSQYYVIDTRAGDIVADFVDDGSDASFSPDGNHFAYETGSPHFAPSSHRAATLFVDGRPVYPSVPQAGLRFVARPRWSPDGHAVALVAQDANGTTSRLVMWVDGQVTEQIVDLGAADTVAVSWSGTRLYISAQRSGQGAPRYWISDASGLTLMPSAGGGADLVALKQARALRAKTLAAARTSGLVQPDAWCAQCGLEHLPRASE